MGAQAAGFQASTRRNISYLFSSAFLTMSKALIVACAMFFGMSPTTAQQDCSYYCHKTQAACDYCRGQHGISKPCYMQNSYCQHCDSQLQLNGTVAVSGNCKYKCHLSMDACETCGLSTGCHCDYQPNSWCENAGDSVA